MACADPDDPATLVVFRRWPNDGSIALFPTLDEGNGHCTCYQHVGQHGAACFAHVLDSTEPCADDDPDLHALLDELYGIGYELRRIDTYPIPPLRACRVLNTNVASSYDW